MRLPLLFVSAAALVVMGCFRLQPITTGAVPATDTKVGVYVNDAGRAALAMTVGQAIQRIEGTLTEQDLEGYVISVQHIYFLQGGVQIWTGEKVRIAKEHVQYFAVRQLSKGRTVALGVVGVGSVALMLSQGLFGMGLGDGPDVPCDTCAASLRLIWP